MGNKADDPDRRVVLEVDAKKFAETMGIQFFETSAKENINVEEVKLDSSVIWCLLLLFKISSWIFS